MRYSKKHVNEIVDAVVEAFSEIPMDRYNAERQVELIREEHLLVDRRTTSLPEYASEVVHDFVELKLAYKELMSKYKCSMRTLKKLLHECSESDPRVYEEIEYRRR